MNTYYNMYYEYVKNFFDRHTITGEYKYVMYPNGNIATIIKDVLMREYNIKPVFIVDNNRYDGKNVFNLKQAKELSDDNTYYLVCSDKEEIYNDIRERLKTYIDDKHIIELFPREVSEQYIESVNRLLDMLDDVVKG